MTGPILFLVPARGGSRRIPGKNLRLVGGIPLVGRAIRTGLAAAALLDGGPHRVVCSTDDDAIAAAAAAWGAKVLHRPAALATDNAGSVEVALHALNAAEAAGEMTETLVLLQPTSPLLQVADLVNAVGMHRTSSLPVTSVVTTHPAAWHRPVGPGDVLGEPGTPAAADTC